MHVNDSYCDVYQPDPRFDCVGATNPEILGDLKRIDAIGVPFALTHPIQLTCQIRSRKVQESLKYNLLFLTTTAKTCMYLIENERHLHRTVILAMRKNKSIYTNEKNGGLFHTMKFDIVFSESDCSCYIKTVIRLLTTVLTFVVWNRPICRNTYHRMRLYFR